MLNDRTKFKVQSSNIASVAAFISRLDEANIVLTPNNCNDIKYDSSNTLLIRHYTSNETQYIHLDIHENGEIVRPILFTNDTIYMNSNLYITGDLNPAANEQYSLGAEGFLWKDLYLSGNTITLGTATISSDPSGAMKIGTAEPPQESSNASNFIATALEFKNIRVLAEKDNSNVLLTSNYMILVSGDSGVEFQYYDSNCNLVNMMPLGVANTSIFAEGSNQYYTAERWENWYSQRNYIDMVQDGTSNRFVLNDVYDGSLNITKQLVVGSNLHVYGSSTIINTNLYQTKQMEITNEGTKTAATIQQNDEFYDVFSVVNISNIAFHVASNSFTGINTHIPQYNLDVNGTLNTQHFRGDGSLIHDLNFTDRNTSMLQEGTNLYFTHERVDAIITSSNIRASNYVNISSNIISPILTDTSNVISERLTDTSNLISVRLTHYSNIISVRLTETSNLISDRLSETSNLISERFSMASNMISERITTLNTDLIQEATNLYYTTARFDERFNSKTLDDFYDGATSNRCIINDTYVGDLHIPQSIRTSNLNATGESTFIYTYTYQSENMVIDTQSENNVALSVRQLQTSNKPIISLLDDNDKGLQAFSTTGFVGINTEPHYTFDVNGIARASVIAGDATMLSNMDVSTITTSYLPESSNLYFTWERAGSIVGSSNADSSNYMQNACNTLADQWFSTSNVLYATFNTHIDTISSRITALTTDEIPEITNLYYTTDRFDERLLAKTLDYIHDGTSNRFVINDIYDGDLSVSCNLHAENLHIVGNITRFDTTLYITSNLTIETTTDDANEPALKLRQNGIYDIFEAGAMKIINGGYVGINTHTPQEKLDIAGTLRATNFVANGTTVFHVNLEDRDTGLLAETSNLWYTPQRTASIIFSSNIDSSNYMSVVYDEILQKTLQTSNLLTQRLNEIISVEIASTCNLLKATENSVYNAILDTSNIFKELMTDVIDIAIVETNYKLLDMATEAENSILDTSNILKDYLDEFIGVSVADTSAELLATSNQLTGLFRDTSNLFTSTIDNFVNVRIKDINAYIRSSSNLILANINNTSNLTNQIIAGLTTNHIAEGSNLYFNDANFMHSLQTLRNVDNISAFKITNVAQVQAPIYTRLPPNIWYQFNEDPNTCNILNDASDIVYNLPMNIFDDFENNTKDMRAWYKFDGDSTTMLYDSSAFATDLVNSGATLDTTHYKIGSSSIHIASNTSVSVSKSAAFYAPNSSFTYCFWLKIAASANTLISILNASYNTLSPYGGISMFIYQGSKLFIQTLNNTGDAYNFIVNDVADNRWKHIAFVVKYDTITSQIISIYLNGVKISEYAGNYYIGSTLNTLTFGGSQSFNIDDFRFYEKALNNTEIGYLYAYDTLIDTYNINLIAPINSNLVAWYKFDDNATNMLLDSSGNGYALTNNGATFDTVNSIGGRGSIQLNKSNNQYFTLNSSINFYNIANATGITFALWIKLESSGGSWWLLNVNGTSSQILWYRNGSSLTISIAEGGTSTTRSVENVIDNAWHHIVWSISSTGVWTIWVDGVNQNISATKTIPNTTYTTRTVGLPFNATDGYARGNIDDFRIYSRVLTNDDVSFLHKNAYHMRSLPFVWYKFNDNTTNMLLDSSGYTYHLTNNNATIDTVNKIEGTSSIKLTNVTGATQQYVSIQNTAFASGSFLHTINHTHGLSIAFFVKLNSSSVNSNKLLYFGNWQKSTGNYDNSFNRIQIRTGNPKTFLSFDIFNTSTFFNFTQNVNYYDDAWHHIVWTISPTGIWDIYIDNLKVCDKLQRTSIPLFLQDDNTIGLTYIIGADKHNTNYGITGNIDDFRIYSKILSAGEVAALYNVRNEKEYPPSSLGAAVGNSLQSSMTLNTGLYGIGRYVVSASSSFAGDSDIRQAFNKSNVSNDKWSSDALYSTQTGIYHGSVSTTYNTDMTYTGEWLQIQVPDTIVLMKYSLAPMLLSGTADVVHRSPKDFVILGSVDGNTWYLLDTRINRTDWATIKEFDVLSVDAYNYYRICVSKTQGGTFSERVAIGEWRLYGYVKNNIAKSVVSTITSYKLNASYHWNNTTSFLVNANSFDIQQLLHSIHHNNLSVHFVLNATNMTIASPILSISNLSGYLLRIYIENSLLNFSIGNATVSATLSNNIWYALDFVFSRANNNYTLSIYVNQTFVSSGIFTGYNNLFNNVLQDGLMFSIGKYSEASTLASYYLQDFRMYSYAFAASNVSDLALGEDTYTLSFGTSNVITYGGNTSNRCITNNTYNSSLNVLGSILSSNLLVYGTFTTIDANVYQTENMLIHSSTEGPALKVVQKYTGCNVFETYDDNSMVMMIDKDGLVGINTEAPIYSFDVNGIMRSTTFIGNARNTSNINLLDRSTSLLSEGSNQYYTALRTGSILLSSNVNSSNYMRNSSNNMSRDITITSNTFIGDLRNVSNMVANDVRVGSMTSNRVLGKLDELFYAEKINSNMLTRHGMEIVAYNNSNMRFTNLELKQNAFIISFNGGSWVRTDQSLDLRNKSFTISLWQKANIGRYQLFLSHGTAQTNNGLHVGYDNATTYGVHFYYNGTGFQCHIPVGQWSHFALVVSDLGNGNCVRSVYENGVLKGSQQTSSYLGIGGINLGVMYHPGGDLRDYFNGSLADVRIYTRALNQQNITDNMNQPPNLQDTSLTVYWTFERVNGIIVDKTGKGYNLTSTFGSPVISLDTENITKLPPNSIPIHNLRLQAYTITSNIPKDEALITSNLNAYLRTTSNNSILNLQSRGYFITSMANDINAFRTLNSNLNINYLTTNSNIFISGLRQTSNNLAITNRLTSNEVASNIMAFSNIMSSYQINTSNSYSNYFITSSNYTQTFLYNITSNHLSSSFVQHYTTNSNMYAISSNDIAILWNATSNSTTSAFQTTSNYLANRIQSDFYHISDRIHNLTLDEISPGINYQYIVNNMFQSNLHVPHHVIAGSLRVEDIDLNMVNQNDVPNQQLKAYIYETTSNAIVTSDPVQNTINGIIRKLSSDWSNYATTKQTQFSPDLDSIKSIANQEIAANIALVTDSVGRIGPYTTAGNNILTKNTMQFLNNTEPIQNTVNAFNAGLTNTYATAVEPLFNSYTLNLSNFLANQTSSNPTMITMDGKVNTKMFVNTTYTSNIIIVQPIMNMNFDDTTNHTNIMTTDATAYSIYKNTSYPIYSEGHTSNLLYWYKFDGNIYNYDANSASNLYLLSGAEVYDPMNRIYGASALHLANNIYHIGNNPISLKEAGYTIAFWFNSFSYSPLANIPKVLLSFADSSNIATATIQCLLIGSNLVFRIRQSAILSFHHTLPLVINNDTFYHITWSITHGMWNIWVNGVLYSTVPNGGYNVNANYIFNTIGSNFYGLLDDFRVYNKSLTSNEIIANTGITHRAYPEHKDDLVVWYNFDGLLLNTVDTSNYNLISTSNLSYSTDKNSGLYSAVFNGTVYCSANMSNIHLDMLATSKQSDNVGITFTMTIKANRFTSNITQHLFLLESADKKNRIDSYFVNDILYCSMTNNIISQSTNIELSKIYANHFYTISWVIAKGSSKFSASWYVYINDVLVYEKVLSSLYFENNYATLYIGSSDDKNLFRGYIDDFRIYAKALHSHEINLIATQLNYPSVSGYTKLLDARLDGCALDTVDKNRELFIMNFNDKSIIVNKTMLFTNSYGTATLNEELDPYNSNYAYYTTFPYNAYYLYTSQAEIASLMNVIHNQGMAIHFAFSCLNVTNTLIYYIGNNNNYLLNIRVANGKLVFDVAGKIIVYSNTEIVNAVWYKVDFVYMFADFNTVYCNLYLNGILQHVSFDYKDYLRYEFKSSASLLNDSSGNNRVLRNVGGGYILESGKNAIIFENSTEGSFANDDWTNYSDLTISGMFKSSNIANGDKILEFANIQYGEPTISPFVAPIRIGNTNQYYMAFTNTSIVYNLTFQGSTVCDILIVGGGGGGGSGNGSGHESGGGGAGGIVYMVNKTFAAGTYKIFVGDGGSASTNGIDSRITNVNDNIITMDNISLVGRGGGAGGNGGNNGNSGGSGGGGAHNMRSGGASTQGNTFWNGTQYVAGGFAGETPNSMSRGGGGGGAAEAGGTDGNSVGGDGRSVPITGTAVFYGGGGSGVFPNSPQPGGDGGGGMPNSSHNNGTAVAGTANTGGGGGGSQTSGGTPVGGRGGSGIVIIRYTLSIVPAGLHTLRILNNRDLLSFQVNNNPVYETPVVWNEWNYFMWNVFNQYTTKSFIRLNNHILQYETQRVAAFPYTNKLGSSSNIGTIYLSDFRIYTGHMTSNMVDLNYGSIYTSNWNSVAFTSDTNVNNYSTYEFALPSLLTFDSSPNKRTLVNDGGVFVLEDYVRSSALLSSNHELILPSDNWSLYPDLTFSGLFKTSNFALGDRILDFGFSSNNIRIVNNSNFLSFVINNNFVHTASNILWNDWNHFTWNIESSTDTRSFVRLNNGPYAYYNQVPLRNGTYMNKLGFTSNRGSLFISDFRIVNIPLTNSIQNDLYHNAMMNCNYVRYAFGNNGNDALLYSAYNFGSNIILDSSLHGCNLVNYGGNYSLETMKDSIYLSAGNYCTVPSINWSNFNDLTLSGWFKGPIANGDKILEFGYPVVSSSNVIMHPIVSPNINPVLISGGDYYIAFTDTSSTYNLTFSKTTVCDILIIGGGGAGGNVIGGGGGAGGVVYQRGVALNAGTYNIRVGAGGTGSILPELNTSASGSFYVQGNDGSSSTISINDSVLQINGITYEGRGGGGGGCGFTNLTSESGRNGGCGGGGSVNGGATSRPGGISTQTNTFLDSAGGFPGYAGASGVFTGGGGGGLGVANPTPHEGNGAAGRQIDITGSMQWYAAGGAGGTISSTTSFFGGSGIGGDGTRNANSMGSVVRPTRNFGVANTGSGGGGGAYDYYGWASGQNGTGGGDGGTGIIIIRYNADSVVPTTVVNGLNISRQTSNITFNIDNVNLYQSIVDFDNWNYFAWNVLNTSSRSFVILNDTIVYYNKVLLASNLYSNSIGSSNNMGGLYVSDFNVLTTPLMPFITDARNSNIISQSYSQVLYEYYTDTVQNNYLSYEFTKDNLLADSSGNNRGLSNNINHSYAYENNIDCLLLGRGGEASFANEDWSLYNDLSLSFRFKTSGIQNRDTILIFDGLTISNTSNMLTFQRNRVSFYQYPLVDNTWYYVIWNIASSLNNRTFIKINNHFAYTSKDIILSANYANRLGSVNNLGSIYFNDFRIFTSPINPVNTDYNLIYNYPSSNSHLRYEFRSQQLLGLDSASNIQLNTSNAIWSMNEGMNSIFLRNSNVASFASDNWSVYSNLTLSGWFKTVDFANADRVLQFSHNQFNNISIMRVTSNLAFRINNSTVYQTTILNNSWNYFIWNIRTTSNLQGFVKLNNGAYNFFHTPTLSSNLYSNILGGNSNVGNLYLADFRILTNALSDLEGAYLYHNLTYTPSYSVSNLLVSYNDELMYSNSAIYIGNYNPYNIINTPNNVLKLQDVRIHTPYNAGNSNIIANVLNYGNDIKNTEKSHIYDYAFSSTTVFGNSSVQFASSNTLGTYVEVPDLNLGASNLSMSFCFKADDGFAEYVSYHTSNLHISNNQLVSSATSNMSGLGNSNIYSCTNFTNMYISGMNINHQLGDGTTFNRTGFVPSWSVDYSVNGVIGSTISKVFISYTGSFGHIYLMENGMLYFLGNNTYSLFGLSSLISIPTMIERFWDIGDSIADISMNANCVYFLTTNGKLYGCGLNQYNNIVENGANITSIVIRPVLINSSWWGGEKISSIGACDGGLVISIGSVVIAKGLVNGTVNHNWNLLHPIANVIKIWTPVSNRIYYLDKDGVYYYNGVRLQVANNEKVVMLSCSGSVAVILTESGLVYTSSTNVFTTLVSASWGADRVVRVSVGSYSSDTYYAYLTASGKIYVSGNSSWGQLNITGTISNPTLMPLINSNNTAKVIEVYATNFGNIMALTSGPEAYSEFDGNKGEFIKYDAGISMNVCGIGIHIHTPHSTTLHRYSLNIKIYASDNDDVMRNRYIRWTKLAEDNRVLSFSANRQLISILFTNRKKYRYYAVLVYCNYNINMSAFYLISQPKYYMTIMSANVDIDRSICICTEGSAMKVVVKNGISEKAITYDVGNRITSFKHYVILFDKNNRLCKLYVDGVNVANETKMPLIADRVYQYNYFGRLHYISEMTGTYDWLNGNLSDFKIYYGLLTDDDILKLMRGDKINNMIGENHGSISSSIFAVETTNNYYLYNNNQQYNYYIANIMHYYGVIMRFFFKINSTINSCIFYLGNAGGRELQISVVNGCLYLLYGAYVICSKRVVDANSWYAFELYTNMSTVMNISVYLNSMPTFISINGSGYALDHSVSYDGSLEPLHDMTSFIGYNPRNNYNPVSWYENGLMFTNTYYNRVVSSNIYSNAQLSSVLSTTPILKYSSNMNALSYGYDTANVPGTIEMIVELNGNVYFEEGYYNFTIHNIHEIACDMLLGFDNILLNVAHYYTSNMHGICMSTDKPLYLQGYYRLNSRCVRSYANSSNIYLNLKYYKRAMGTYHGDYYTVVSPIVNYVVASNVANLETYVGVETTRVFVSKNMIVDRNFYMDMNAYIDVKMYIQDLRIYNNSDNYSSNIANGFRSDGYYYNMVYDKYDEVVDVNRWRKTDGYYLYHNGVLNRSTYYDEGNVGIGTSSVNASLDVYTKTSGVYSIKTNNPIWVNNSFANSDLRIKKDVCDIDDGYALQKLMLIEPKIYEYIDKNRQTKDVYGFIAQQVGEVLEEAVKKEKEFIPNIYSISLVGGNMLIFPEDVDMYSKVILGDSLQIIYENGMRDIVKVENIVNQNIIIIDKLLECDKVFVYGKEVDDFHVLDKNYIYTLNVCATQDLYKQMVEESKIIEMQEKLILELEKRAGMLE
jgi:hypothetical protein